MKTGNKNENRGESYETRVDYRLAPFPHSVRRATIGSNCDADIAG